MSASPLRPTTLCGRFVRLEPVEPHHHPELIAAAADPELWKYVPFEADKGYAGKLAAALAAVAAGTQVIYAVRRCSDGVLAGSASFLAIAPVHARVEIGAIWYRAEDQGTAVNPETMQLMLDHAFANGYNRVEFKADARNARSRAAIRKLGATEEGILRQHLWLPQGRFRDSVYSSILADEWPALREKLQHRLNAFG